MRAKTTKLFGVIFLGVVLVTVPAFASAKQFRTYGSPTQFLQMFRKGESPGMPKIDWLVAMKPGPHPSCSVKKAWRGELETGKMNTVLDVLCNTGEFLAVLGPTATGRWRFEGGMYLWSVRGNLSVHLEAIVKPPVEEIVIHHYQIMSGTGIGQSDLMIFKVEHHRLRKVLDTVENSSVERWTKPFLWVSQHSTFKIVPATAKQAAEVDETSTITTDSSKVVLQRSFDWSKRTGTFDVGLWFPTLPAKKSAKN